MGGQSAFTKRLIQWGEGHMRTIVIDYIEAISMYLNENSSKNALRPYNVF